MLTQNLVRVELLRSCQCLGLSDRLSKAIPWDHCRDRIKGVLLGLARCNEGGANTCIEANLLVDRAAVSLKGTSMPALGLAEHCPDQAVEQIDGLVRQAGDQVEGNGDQSRVAALSFVFGDMLRRGTTRLAGKLGKASLMHAMPTRRLDADCADMVQTLDQAEHRNRLRRFWHLAQPGEPALVGFRPPLRQRIEPLPLFGR